MKQRASFRLLSGARFLFAVGLALFFIAVVSVANVSAAPPPPRTFTVTSTADTGDSNLIDQTCDDGTGHCTLRAAIQNANAFGASDTIQFNIPTTDPNYVPHGNPLFTIGLSSALPDLSTNININGPGPNVLEIGGDGTFAIFNISAAPVTLAGMRIRFGTHGIFVTNTATVSVINCQIEDNAGSATGGGILNVGGTLSVADSWILFNSTFGGSSQGAGVAGLGGGIYNSGTLTISNSALNYNIAEGGSSATSTGGQGAGGGIYNAGTGTATVINCTMFGNEAHPGAGSDISLNGSAIGGGICNNDAATLNVTNSTITRNKATGNAEGGGIYASTGSAAAYVKSTILALNTAASGPDGRGPFQSQGFNLIGIIDGSSTGFTEATDLTGTVNNPLDPKFDTTLPFIRGGRTPTIGLRIDSPAIDQGTSSSLVGSLTTDQRGGGFARRIDKSVANASGGDGTDIGAFELGTSVLSRPDFNDDGFADYLLFNPSTLRTAMWYLHGSILFGGSYGPTLPAGWVVVGAADFDSNGTPDYLLFRPSTRQTAVWFLNKATLIGGSFGPTLPAGWNLVAAADFDRDGRPDYVLFNPTTRQSAVWFLNRTTFISGAFGPTLPAGWTLLDALPLYLIDNPEYLLFNPTTRQTAVWRLNGTAFGNASFGPTLPAGWILAGASSFDGPPLGAADYVLFQPSTRRTAIWFLSGTAFLRGEFGPTLPAGYNLVVP